MPGSVNIGDRVKHHNHGRGVVVRLVGNEMAEVRFGETFEYVQQKSLYSIEKIEREELQRETQKIRDARRHLKDRVITHLNNFEYTSAHSLYQNHCQEWWPKPITMQK